MVNVRDTIPDMDPMVIEMSGARFLFAKPKSYLVGGFSPTLLNNMQPSNWIISPMFGVKIKDSTSLPTNLWSIPHLS